MGPARSRGHVMATCRDGAFEDRPFVSLDTQIDGSLFCQQFS